MQRGFGGTAFEPVQERRDRELTLGPTMLAALVCGLIALCGLCFVLGYGVGRRSPGDAGTTMVQTASGTLVASATAAAQAKPSAAQSSFQPQVVQTDAPNLTGSDTAPAGASVEAAVDVPVSKSTGTETAAANTGDAVRTALPTQAAAQSVCCARRWRRDPRSWFRLRRFLTPKTPKYWWVRYASGDTS